MFKINYVIATYGKKNNRNTKFNKYPILQNTLKDHLLQISKFKNNISKITIMKPAVDLSSEKELLFFKEYYNIEECLTNLKTKIEIIEVKNQLYSYGQWIEAFKKDKNESDFIICTEDDYIPNKDNFDQHLINKYIEIFDNKYGVLCSLIEKIHFSIKKFIFLYFNLIFKYFKFYSNLYFIIGEGVLVFNKLTINKILRSNKNIISKLYSYNLTNSFIFGLYKDLNNNMIGYEGGYSQTAFFYLIHKLKIKSKSYKQADEIHFWWNESQDQLEFLGSQKKNTYNDIISKVKKNLFIPIQINGSNFIKNISKKNPKLILILGMHRTGTSLLGNCLYELGIDYGIKKNMDKNIVNPNGYFENDSFTQFFDHLLLKNNMEWKNIKFNELKYNHADIIKFKNILENEFFSNNFYFIKDPRIVKFINFFKLNFIEYEIYYVVTKRNKTDTIDSLTKAQEISYDNALKLYNTHYEIIKNNLKDYFAVDHKDLLYDTESVIKKLTSYLNIKYKDLKHLVNKNLHRSK